MFRNILSSERSRHAGIAIGLALVAWAIALLKPVDIAIWSFQSKLVDRAASGEIVLIEVDRARNDKTGAFNRSLSDLIRELRARDAGRVFVDVPLVRSNSAEADNELRSLLKANEGLVFIAEPSGADDRHVFAEMRSDLFFTRDLATLDNRYDIDFLGFVWDFPSRGADGRETLAFALAGDRARLRQVSIDTSIDTGTLPRIGYPYKATSSHGIDAAGKTFVVGNRLVPKELRLAKNGYDSSSVAHIMAAETMMRGRGQTISGWVLTLLFGCFLLVGLWLASSRWDRRIAYLAWVSSVALLVGLSAFHGVRVYFADTLLLAMVYGSLRGVSNYRNRHIYIDPITKLPNFSALIRDMQDADGRDPTGIIAAKILRLDAIFAEFSLREKRLYLQQIAKRLALSDEAARIYFDDGKYFAFLIKDNGHAENQAHLAGLRAIVSQPLSVDSVSIDVAITIGADFSFDATTEHRLSSAISAADQAREAFRPVFVVTGSAGAGEEWDHSLTARLAEALAQDRIKIKLQPQVDLRSGEYVGAEALARWHDKDGREIPPDRFISQCEQMGRLDDLTKRIMERSMAALQLLQQSGHDIAISVNVSAVQLVDDRIAQMVENRIDRYGIDPSRLKLEITETARIEDLETAAGIMQRLRSNGISFSLDDFGVGSANLEVLTRLPFDEVKIDRMFVKDLMSSHVARSIVAGTLGICQGMGVSSVAEGIEDLRTYRLLADLGCDYGQGYFIAKPQWISQFVTTLEFPKEGDFRQMLG